MNINVAEMLKAGMTQEDIQAIISAEIAKAAKTVGKAKNDTVVTIGTKLADTGVIATEDAILLIVELLKVKMPAVAGMLDELGGLDIDNAKALAKELDPMFKLYDGVLVLAIESGVDLGGSQSKEVAELLKMLGKR